jgi:type IV pilus assembly protein PilM
MRVVVVAARRTMIAAFVEAIRAAGLRPEGIDLDAFAIIRALDQAEGREVGARVFCHLAGVTNLAVAVGNSCVYTRPLSASWEGDAEHAASALADEMRLSIDSYRTLPDALPVESFVLSGPGASVPNLAEELAMRLGVEGVIAPPLGRLDGSLLSGDEDPHRYTVAAGLAIGAAA